jgi:hypothetical protein
MNCGSACSPMATKHMAKGSTNMFNEGRKHSIMSHIHPFRSLLFFKNNLNIF